MHQHKGTIGIIVLILMILAVIFLVEWIKADAKHQPKSIVTTIHGDARTSRAFTWYTVNPNADTVLQLIQGKDPANWNQDQVMTVQGSTTTIETSKGTWQGVHKVTVTGLAPGTEYSYRVGSGKSNEWSDPAQFLTEADDTEAFTFIHITDSQGTTEQDFDLWGKTLNRAFQQFPEARFIVHGGDLTEDPDNEQGWDYFFQKSRTWLQQIPLQPVTGNHEEINEDAERFTSHFIVPDNGAEDSTPGTNYSFDYGNAHITVLNTESNIDGQTEWLRADLAATDKPWKIVAMHRPAYGGNITKNLKDWVKVFDEFQVDLVLQGHNHEYMRSYPLRNGKIVMEEDRPVQHHEGTVYVVTNASGPKFNKQKKEQFYHKVHFQNESQMFAGITIDHRTLTFQAYDVEGNRLDSFVIQHDEE
ncbi:metallophosphoesterase [Paenibacillus selenitireducens]|uniref:Metallophosphoesterase n=1 Tax=Paenibacillus selenitireducens TaxID=1324314 RepID=A0A1T2XNC6_9BACL|nr:metallophosphoesterase family protein [Paenibacillus selenitireducens]OPA81246.1 metallophosphoesterase [Paenibacillus selenitireducens]